MSYCVTLFLNRCSLASPKYRHHGLWHYYAKEENTQLKQPSHLITIPIIEKNLISAHFPSLLRYQVKIPLPKTPQLQFLKHFLTDFQRNSESMRNKNNVTVGKLVIHPQSMLDAGGLQCTPSSTSIASPIFSASFLPIFLIRTMEPIFYSGSALVLTHMVLCDKKSWYYWECNFGKERKQPDSHLAGIHESDTVFLLPKGSKRQIPICFRHTIWRDTFSYISTRY